MANKTAGLRFRIDPAIKQQLTEIRDHHYRNGDIDMSMTHITELLISKEHKRLKLGKG